MLRTTIALVMVAAALGDPAARLVGEVRIHQIQAGDTLVSVAARAGIDIRTLAIDNGLEANAKLRVGDSLTVDNRHIVPAGYRDGIVINVPQRMLFLFEHGQAVKAYPVALGRRDWRTPLGEFTITVKEADPEWNVPASIQREMARNRRPVLATVPPGPDNPLGKYWLGLSGSGVGIHGTNQPASIYRFATHGCIRLHPDDVEDLFHSVSVGTVVQMIYEPVLLATDAESIFLEIHPDVYGRTASSSALSADLLGRANLGHLIGSAAVARVVADGAGRAVRIACLPRAR